MFLCVNCVSCNLYYLLKFISWSFYSVLSYHVWGILKAFYHIMYGASCKHFIILCMGDPASIYFTGTLNQSFSPTFSEKIHSCTTFTFIIQFRLIQTRQWLRFIFCPYDLQLLPVCLLRNPPFPNWALFESLFTNTWQWVLLWCVFREFYSLTLIVVTCFWLYWHWGGGDWYPAPK